MDHTVRRLQSAALREERGLKPSDVVCGLDKLSSTLFPEASKALVRELRNRLRN
jgi:hypothetical protein